MIVPFSSYSIQQTIVNDSIIIQGLVQYNNDDETALENIIPELKETEVLLDNLQKKVGETGGEKTIKNAFKKSTMLLSTKYCSNENLQTAYLNDFKILTKPKELAREINKKYRDDNTLYKDEIFENIKDLQKDIYLEKIMVIHVFIIKIPNLLTLMKRILHTINQYLIYQPNLRNGIMNI